MYEEEYECPDMGFITQEEIDAMNKAISEL